MRLVESAGQEKRPIMGLAELLDAIVGDGVVGDGGVASAEFGPGEVAELERLVGLGLTRALTPIAGISARLMAVVPLRIAGVRFVVDFPRGHDSVASLAKRCRQRKLRGNDRPPVLGIVVDAGARRAL